MATDVSRRVLYGRERKISKENPFYSNEEESTISTNKSRNGGGNPFDDEVGLPPRGGLKGKLKNHSTGSLGSIIPFSSDDEASKPPRHSSLGGQDDDERRASRTRNARKEPVRRGPTSSSSSHTDELFSYGDSKPKSGGYHQNDGAHVADGMYDSHQPPQGGEEEEYVNQAVQDLEKYALKKSQDTTSTIKNCVRVAEDTMGIGVQTLITLHDQGIQIERTHEKAVDIDQHLSRGEKLLGSLGGVFSKTWKPKKTKKITGPMIGRADNHQQKESPADREALGLNGEPMKKRSGGSAMHDQTTVSGQLDAERDTQDNMLEELSTVISQMKEMSMDLNVEIQRQAPGIDHLSDDIEELNSRVRGANVRGQRLLRR